MAEPSVKIIKNTMKCEEASSRESLFTEKEVSAVRRIHEMVKGYAQTDLVSLSSLAAAWGVKAVLVKDESTRFGLKAFKGLGGIYAMIRMICRELSLAITEISWEDLFKEPFAGKIRRMTFITTTDGNHGKGVSWAASVLGARAVVYMPAGTVPVRAQAIREAGTAEVYITDLNYDACVRYTRKLSEERNWFLIQDTSWEGYEQVPLWIMQGYLTLFGETFTQIEKEKYPLPTHVFVQAGVGSAAGTAAAYLHRRFGKEMPVFCCVEPHEAACLYESFEIADGKPHTSSGSDRTIMAGLNCGTPCSLAWDILKGTTSFAFSCGDEISVRGMRLLAHPSGSDRKIVSGESGAVCVGLADYLLSENADHKRLLGLDDQSVLLFISTEGDTDPENYARITGTKGNPE